MRKVVILGKPIAWKRAGTSGKRFYDRQTEEKVAYQWQMKTAFPFPPLRGPLLLSGTFSFSMPKSWSKSKKVSMLNKPHSSVPDLDNLIKFVQDAAKGILWEDDRIICRFSNVDKIWGDKDFTILEFDDLN